MTEPHTHPGTSRPKRSCYCECSHLFVLKAEEIATLRRERDKAVADYDALNAYEFLCRACDVVYLGKREHPPSEGLSRHTCGEFGIPLEIHERLKLESQITDLERSLQEAQKHIRELAKGDPEAAELVLSRIVQRLDTVVEEGVWPEKVEMAIEEVCADLTLKRARIADLESEQAAALVMAADLLAEATRLKKRLAGGL